MKETIVKMNKTKSWLFEKISNQLIDIPLARLINKIRNEKREVTTDNAEVQRL